MGGQPFSGILCIICAEAVDLTVDLVADENGKAMHQDCYVRRTTTGQVHPSVATMND
jgi:hypothetical protein